MGKLGRDNGRIAPARVNLSALAGKIRGALGARRRSAPPGRFHCRGARGAGILWARAPSRARLPDFIARERLSSAAAARTLRSGSCSGLFSISRVFIRVLVNFGVFVSARKKISAGISGYFIITGIGVSQSRSVFTRGGVICELLTRELSIYLYIIEPGIARAYIRV